MQVKHLVIIPVGMYGQILWLITDKIFENENAVYL